MTIQEWLRAATAKLKTAAVPSARLDAELLLSRHLKKPREYLLAHPEIQLGKGPSFAQLESWLRRRTGHEPLAYILGEKEFYGRTFAVTPDVLIPRPESEAIVELIKELVPKKKGLIIDVGTGSGALAVSLKLEMPACVVMATDISASALLVAQKNARRLGADVTFVAADLLGAVPLRAGIIVANLPYVGADWDVSPETKHEPRLALYAGGGGLDIVKRLIAQAPARLQPDGHMLLEADPRQHDEIIAYAGLHGFKLAKRRGFILVLQA